MSGQIFDNPPYPPGRVVVLCGPGGIGKIVLAAEANWILVQNVLLAGPHGL